MGFIKDGGSSPAPKKEQAPRYEGEELARNELNLSLMRAAARAELAEVEDLLSRGADPDFEDRTGAGPLLAAVGAALSWLDDNMDHRFSGGEANAPGRAQVVRRLLAAGADPRKIRRPQGVTALMGAASLDDGQIARLLLPVSDIFAVDSHGMSALVIAAFKKSQESVDDLLAAGALDSRAAERLERLWGQEFLKDLRTRERALREKAMWEQTMAPAHMAGPKRM